MIWVITIVLVVALTGCVFIYGDSNTVTTDENVGLVNSDHGTAVEGDNDSVTDDDVLEVEKE